MGNLKHWSVAVAVVTAVHGSHATEPMRCLRDGKVIITDASCAALGAAIDMNPPLVEQVPPKTPEAISRRPLSFQPVTPPNPALPQKSIQTPPAPQIPIPATQSESSGFLKWVFFLAGVAFFLHFSQKKTKREAVRRTRSRSPIRVVEPSIHKPQKAEGGKALDYLLSEITLEKAEKQKIEELPYKQAPLMSRYELEFFQRLRTALPECEIFPQVPLAAFIRIDRKKAGRGFFQNSYRWQNRIAQQRVDYLVCLRTEMTIVAAVELDDPSHDNDDAEARDQKKDKSLQDAGVPFVRWRVETMPSIQEIRAQFAGTSSTGDQCASNEPLRTEEAPVERDAPSTALELAEEALGRR